MRQRPVTVAPALGRWGHAAGATFGTDRRPPPGECCMKRSTDRILTTHVGSLARPHDLLDTMKERENGRPYDHDLFDRQVRDAVADRVRQQVEAGIDIVTDGEMSKVSFLGYVKDRLGGFEVDMGDARLAPSWQKEVDDFPDYYADYFKKYSATVSPLRRIICTGPDQLRRPGAAADRHRQPEGGHRAATTWPTCSCRPPGPSGFGRNEYYATPRGVPARRGRGHARGVPGHRGRRLHPPDRRSVPHRHAERPHARAGGARAGRRGSTSRR